MTFSQFGEDDIIDNLLGVPQSAVITDIGAGDGVEISNSRLFRERGWFTVLAESDPVHLDALGALEGPLCALWLEKVTPETVDEAVHPLTDVLSIDVDGDDIFLFEALTHRPEIVVIEYNPTMPLNQIVRPARRGLRIGASVGALDEVAADKDYGLVAVTHCNAIFWREAESTLVFGDDLPYTVATEYFTGRPFVIGTPPWGMDFANPYPAEDVIVR